MLRPTAGPQDLSRWRDPNPVGRGVETAMTWPRTPGLAGRLVDLVDPPDLLDAVGASLAQRSRVQAYRPLWASFWSAVLLPGSSGFHRRPSGTTEARAEHLIGSSDRGAETTDD